MYIAGNQITVTWILEPTATPLLFSDYDIRIVEGDLDGTYDDADIAEADYSAPCADRAGSITWTFTPNYPGHWKLQLTCGVAAAYLVLDTKNFYVFCYTADFTTEASTDVLGPSSIIPLDCPPLVWGASGDTFNADALSTHLGVILNINPEGTKLFYVENNEVIFEIDMDAYDLSTAVYNSVFFDWGGGNKLSAQWNGDGTTMWISTTASSGVYLTEYSVTTPYTLAGMALSGRTVLGSQFPGMTFHYNFAFGDNGNSIYVSDRVTLDRIFRYTLSVPYDPTSTVVATGEYIQLGTSPNNTVFGEFQFNSNGSELWVEQQSTTGGVTGYAILVYAAGTIWDPSTYTLDSTPVDNSGAPGSGFILANDNYVVIKNNSAPDNELREWKGTV